MSKELNAVLKSHPLSLEARAVARYLAVVGHADPVEIAEKTGFNLTSVCFSLNHLREHNIAQEQSLFHVQHQQHMWCLTREEWLA